MLFLLFFASYHIISEAAEELNNAKLQQSIIIDVCAAIILFGSGEALLIGIIQCVKEKY